MKILIPILLLLLAAWAVRTAFLRQKRGGGCCGEHEEAVRKAPVLDKNRSHYPYRLRMEIGGMTCSNCVGKVENALNSLPGTWAKVDIGTKMAYILSKEPPDGQRLKRAVSSAGYVVLKVDEGESW